jgi:Na+(H+)/acetate symporter ActP
LKGSGRSSCWKCSVMPKVSLRFVVGVVQIYSELNTHSLYIYIVISAAVCISSISFAPVLVDTFFYVKFDYLSMNIGGIHNVMLGILYCFFTKPAAVCTLYCLRRKLRNLSLCFMCVCISIVGQIVLWTERVFTKMVECV